MLDEASVTGTANIIMASVFAEGTTTIYNAACEPYIQQLCHMLNRMGANISGIGSNLLTIVGVDKLCGTEHRLLPDMIEVGSFIGMAAMCGDGIRIKDVSIKDLGIIPEAFRRLGVDVQVDGDDLYIPRQKHYVVDSFIDGTIMTLADAPWPGLTPDLLSVLIVVATQGRGSVLFHQKIQFIRNILNDEDIVMKSRGEQFRSWLYVVDCAVAMLLLLTKGNSGEAYNVANEESNITIRQLAEEIAKIGNKKVVFDLAENGNTTPITKAVFSTEKLNQLGWKPLFSIEEGLAHTIQSMRL